MSSGTIVVDLDGTLCEQRSSPEYHLAAPRHETISVVNRMHQRGWRVIVFTARGMRTCNGDSTMADAMFRPLSERWLRENGVEYDDLLFGKPQADYYVDDKSLTPEGLIDVEGRIPEGR